MSTSPGGLGLFSSVLPVMDIAQGNYGKGIGSLLGGGLAGEGLLGGALGGLGSAAASGLGLGGLGTALGAFGGPIGMLLGGLLGSTLFGGKENSPPIRDIAAAYSQGTPISDASWAKAGLPSGGGPAWQNAVAQASALGPLSGLFQGHNTPTMDQQQAILMGRMGSPQGGTGAQTGGAMAPGAATGMASPNAQPQPFTPAAPLNVAPLPANFQGGMMRNPQWMQLAGQRFPGLLG